MLSKGMTHPEKSSMGTIVGISFCCASGTSLLPFRADSGMDQKRGVEHLVAPTAKPSVHPIIEHMHSVAKERRNA